MTTGARGRSPWRLGVLASAVAVAVIVQLLTSPARAVTGEYTFAPSGLDGAGFQNVVAYSPFRDDAGNRPLLIGADIAGVHRSLDGGRTWLPANAGLGDPHVAALLFSGSVPGKVYAATDSALYVSTDFGQQWTARPGPVDFDANGHYLLANREHPRPTGSLLALDESGPTTYLYAATATQGVKRSSDDGASWEKVALAGHHLRSIALHPSDPDALFVGDVQGGLQISRDARTDLTFTSAPGGPAVAEELEFVGDVLYVAGGIDGVFRYDGAWQDLDVGSAGRWQSITGYVDATTGQTVLVVGCSDPVGGRHTMRSVDGGATWTAASAGIDVSWNVQLYGGSTDWWAGRIGYLSPSGKNFVTADIAVDPDDPTRLVVAGRGGAYVAETGPAGVSWWPAMSGLTVTVNMTAVADPKVAGRVYVGNMDWTFLASADGAASFVSAVPAGAPTTGDVVALDVDGPAGQPSTVYLGASRRGQNTGLGVVYSNPDPVANPGGWTNERLPVSNDVVALGVGRAASGNRVILASVTNRGLYRKDGAAWTKVTGTTPFGSGGYGSFAWVPGTPVVYAMDGGGIWRSRSAGAQGSWVKLTGGSAAYGNATSLVLDPRHPGVLYAADDSYGGVIRLSGADTATPVRRTILALADPGPIAVTPTGALLAHDRRGGRLLGAAAPNATDPVFTDVGNTFFEQNNGNIRTLSVGPDGYAYTASNSAGVTVAAPPDPPPPDTVPPSAPGELTSPAQTWQAVSLTWAPATDDVGVAGYRVLRDGVVVGVAPSPAYVDGAVTPSTTVSYRVQAVDAAGNAGEPGNELTVAVPAWQDATPPTTPGGLNGRLVSPTQVDLSWQASVDDTGVVGYRVSRDGDVLTTGSARTYTDRAMTPGPHTYRVAAVDAAGNVSANATATVTVPVPAPGGLTGTYFDTDGLTSPKLTRVDPRVDFAWGTARPATPVAPDTFSVRWTGRVIPTADGTWTFVTQSDDGVRLWVNGKLVVNNWTTHTLTENRGSIVLTADRAYDIRLEYFDRTGAATIRLLWSGPGTSQRLIPTAQLLSG